MGDKSFLDNLIALALIVREDFDKRYNNNLCGLCCQASTKLYLLARKQGIQVKIAESYGFVEHVFLILEDKIVDVTATQFGFPEGVAILPLDKKERLAELIKIKKFEDFDPWDPHEVTTIQDLNYRWQIEDNNA